MHHIFLNTEPRVMASSFVRSSKEERESMEPDLSVIRHLKSRGKFADARAQLEQWMAAERHNPYLEAEMGGVLDELGLIEEAVQFYEQALRHDPPAVLMQHLAIVLGNDLRLLGRIHESRQVLEKARSQGAPNEILDAVYALTLWRDEDRSAAFRLLWHLAMAGLDGERFDLYRGILRYGIDHLNDAGH
ncbi:hypothetical protein CO251_03710 [Sulfobacillus sp. hq2]|nr:hypothetical protein CO251_03710 [Sulfobacillus sp. hq2]